jgi:hypothetical protein
MFPNIKTKLRNKKSSWAFRAAVIATVILSISSFWVSGAPRGYVSGRLWLANQPDGQSPYVKYYIDGKEQPADKINWVDGRNWGKAISLSGKGEYLELGYNQLQVHTMTIAGWFYWKGTAEGMEQESMYSQRFFTLAHSKEQWLSVMPHAKNPDVKDKNGDILDGIYMAFSMGKGKEKVFYEFFNPADQGKVNYGIPVNEWHHIALTMNGRSLCLYVDGQLWFERMLILGVEEMRNNRLRIGGGIWDEPTLNALVDDLAIYSFAMNSEQIKMLYSDINPQEKGATVPTTSAPALPEPPQTPQTSSIQSDRTIFGLPSWIFYMAIGLLAVFVILSLILSARKPTNNNRGSGEGGRNL